MPDLTETGPVWWAVGKGESIETRCSLDGKNFTSVRQGYFLPSTAEVGVMCAAPEGHGFEAEFDRLSLSPVKQQGAKKRKNGRGAISIHAGVKYGSRR